MEIGILWCRRGMVGHDGLHRFRDLSDSRSETLIHYGNCCWLDALLLYSFSLLAVHRWNDCRHVLGQMEIVVGRAFRV